MENIGSGPIEQTIPGNYIPEQQGVQSPPVTGIEGFKSGSVEEGIRPSKTDKFWLKAQEALMGSPFGTAVPGMPSTAIEGTAWRAFDEWHVNRENEKIGLAKISPEQAKKEYGIDTDAPIFPEIAQSRAATKQRIAELSAWAERGPETGLFFDLAVGATTMADPANIALNLVGAKAVGYLGSKVAATYGIESKAFKTLFTTATNKKGAQTISSRLVVTLADNFAQNLASDSLAYQQLKKEIPAEYSDVLKNAFAGAVVGTALHKIMGYGYHKAAQVVDATRNNIITDIIKQEELGRKVKPSPELNTVQKRMEGKLATGDSIFNHQQTAHPSEIPHYAGVNTDGSQSTLGQAFGADGVVLDSNHQRVNNHVSNADGMKTGTLTENHISKDAVFLDLEKTIADPEAAKFLARINEKLDVELEYSPETTLHQVLDDIRSQVAPSEHAQIGNDIASAAKEAGYDGYRYKNQVDGKEVSNGALVFDKQHVTEGQSYDANKEVTPRTSPDEKLAAEQANAEPTNQKHYDPQQQEELKTYEMKPVVIPSDESIALAKQQEAEARKVLSSAVASDDLGSPYSQAIEAEVALIDKEFNDKIKENKAVKMLADCMVESIT